MRRTDKEYSVQETSRETDKDKWNGIASIGLFMTIAIAVIICILAMVFRYGPFYF